MIPKKRANRPSAYHHRAISTSGDQCRVNHLQTTTAQLINFSDYLGYRLTTTLGFELTRTSFGGRRSELTTRSFITIYSGVER